MQGQRQGQGQGGTKTSNAFHQWAKLLLDPLLITSYVPSPCPPSSVLVPAPSPSCRPGPGGAPCWTRPSSATAWNGFGGRPHP